MTLWPAAGLCTDGHVVLIPRPFYPSKELDHPLRWELKVEGDHPNTSRRHPINCWWCGAPVKEMYKPRAFFNVTWEATLAAWALGGMDGIAELAHPRVRMFTYPASVLQGWMSWPGPTIVPALGKHNRSKPVILFEDLVLNEDGDLATLPEMKYEKVWVWEPVMKRKGALDRPLLDYSLDPADPVPSKLRTDDYGV